ncbi:class I SAM-dependent methyltransferase [Dyadobacter sp. MSC1_007]|jgi:cyclopropane fatty-acyl-phospholipid synthase-like methyltransferase|uniref:class I SAM-dependent methyltransferase n=1 Tax=Dyadobacter sp. MSC1_007 TaxID=2909264 RepID=UPI002030CAFB|nr:class I SAM-dependent methyltransferase [Dyadobacter sp. MSC1_007]
MKTKLSPRLEKIVDALPLREGIRVLEIGCGPGSAAREVARRIGHGHVLGIDRSVSAIRQAGRHSAGEPDSATVSFRTVAIEDFQLDEDEEKFDLAFAVRVGAFDGRHPEIEDRALTRVKLALKAGGKLYIDGSFRFQQP